VSEAQRLVRVADAAVAGAGDVLVTLGLGSCVAILLHDPGRSLGGLAHVLLPEPITGRPDGRAAKYASTAVPHLVAELASRGADRERLRGVLVGGASMVAALAATGSLQMGARNIVAARAALCTAGIPIHAEDVGEEHGRTVHFHPGDGRVVVSARRRPDLVLWARRSAAPPPRRPDLDPAGRAPEPP
jgi:chemotaxis protein CheD